MNKAAIMAHSRRASGYIGRWIARAIGGVLTAVGVVGMLTPIPFGIVFFIIGLMFLIPSTPAAAVVVKRARRKVKLLDRSMTAISRRLPLPYRRILRMTEVERY